MASVTARWPINDATRNCTSRWRPRASFSLENEYLRRRGCHMQHPVVHGDKTRRATPKTNAAPPASVVDRHDFFSLRLLLLLFVGAFFNNNKIFRQCLASHRPQQVAAELRAVNGTGN